MFWSVGFGGFKCGWVRRWVVIVIASKLLGDYVGS